MDDLKKLCEEYFRLDSEGEYVDEDLEHYIFEAAMETTLGKDVWERLRKASRQAEIRKKKEEIERLRKEIEDGE